MLAREWPAAIYRKQREEKRGEGDEKVHRGTTNTENNGISNRYVYVHISLYIVPTHARAPVCASVTRVCAPVSVCTRLTLRIKARCTFSFSPFAPSRHPDPPLLLLCLSFSHTSMRAAIQPLLSSALLISQRRIAPRHSARMNRKCGQPRRWTCIKLSGSQLNAKVLPR